MSAANTGRHRPASDRVVACDSYGKFFQYEAIAFGTSPSCSRILVVLLVEQLEDIFQPVWQQANESKRNAILLRQRLFVPDGNF